LRTSKLTAIFAPDPPQPVTVTDLVKIRARFKSWHVRILFSTIIGYATFYFVRKNLSIAQPVMAEKLHLTKIILGGILTLYGLVYGLSKFWHGIVGDRANARKLMVTGIVGSAVANLFFGESSSAVALGIFWMVNGYFQGMGFPPCARLLTHWFPPKQLASKMSIWNTSHCIGGGLIVILCGYLVAAGWRYCFFVPAALALVCAFYLSRTLPDTPPSVGLPEVEGTQEGVREETNAEFRSMLMNRVFRNKYIWIISSANFFVYTIRFAVFDWGPTLITETKHYEIKHAAYMLFGFECAGAIGALIAGWMTDRFFHGRAMRVGVFAMALAGVSLWLFWKVPHQTQLESSLFLCATGFFIYCPQCLIATAVANLATKRAAATAIGLTSIFGYASTLLSGAGLGTLVQYEGWDAGFEGLLIVAGIGVLVCAASWPAEAHGYGKVKLS
jgi:OPA family glycerol-3-phosphate transporter-like MFS transporter/OPA family sugar phosphate sensor protein UhpC-like MFS transporter